MDETVRLEMQRAFENDDLAKADFGRWQVARERRSANDDLIRRDFSVEPQPRSSITPQRVSATQSAATMDPESQRPWDEWCDSRIKNLWNELFMPAIASALSHRLEETCDIVGEETGKTIARQTDAFEGRIAALQGAIDNLQQTLDELRDQIESASELEKKFDKLRVETALLNSKFKRAQAKSPPSKSKRSKGRSDVRAA